MPWQSTDACLQIEHNMLHKVALALMAGAALWTMFLYILYRTSRRWLGYDRVSSLPDSWACLVMKG